MLRAALIGLPSVGKTTLFQLMTSSKEGGGKPRGDTTIGVSHVPDERLNRLTAMFRPRKRVPASVEFLDLAGARTASTRDLVDVAPYRSADALVHVLRLFRDASVAHIAGSIDAATDARQVEDELVLADLGVAERRIERLQKDMKKGAVAEMQHELAVLERCRAALESGTPIRALALPADDQKPLRGFQFLSAKPLLLVLNLDEADAGSLDRAPELAGLTDFLEGAATRAVGVCGRIELEIAQLDPDEASAFMADLGVSESGLHRVIRASYDLLGYISFFTVGEDECRAWSIPRGTRAQAAAGEIHSDIERGFIRAEVVSYDDLIAAGSLAACKERGLTRLEGKDYMVRDGDVVNFRFAT